MSATQPTYNGVPFGQSGLKNTIPTTTGTFGKASFTAGFPNETMLDPTSGGIAPDGKDVNGILNQLSQHQVWLNAGGQYKFNAALATVVGGYALGAVVQSDDNTKSYVNTLAGNTSNPNIGGAGWDVFTDATLRSNLASTTGSTLITHQYSLTGATPYPLSIFMNGFVTPLGFMSTAMQNDVLSGALTMDHTAAVQLAINSGRNVNLCGLSYKVNNLTQSISGQSIVSSQGIGKLIKNANGPILTSTASNNFRMQNISGFGDASTPVFTGNGFVATGNDTLFDNCGCRWIAGRALLSTGSHTQIQGTCDIYQTSDTSSTGYDIELGVSGKATLYHQIAGIYTTQATGGILATSCGTWGISGCQFGKLTIYNGGAPAGTSAPRVTNNRILGAIHVDAANGSFTCNQFSGATINFDVGARPTVFDLSNVLQGGTTITNNTGVPTGVWSERNVSGSTRFAVQYGGDSSLAIVRFDPLDGSFCPDSHLRLKKQKNIYMQNAAATGDFNVMWLDTSDNLNIGTSGSGIHNINFTSGTGLINFNSGNGVVQNTYSIPYMRLIGTLGGTNQGDFFVSGASLGIRLNGSNGLRLEASQFRPETDNVLSLGTAFYRFTTVYASNGTISTSDMREKQQIRSLSEQERAIAVRLKGMIKAFKFNDAVTSKGDSARIHFGVMAQEVKEAFEAEGLVAEHYAILCYDEWDETPEVINEDGVVQPYIAAGNRYGIRYDELAMFILSAI